MHLGIITVVVIAILAVHANVSNGSSDTQVASRSMLTLPSIDAIHTEISMDILQEPTNIFDKDNRVAVTSTKYPWKAIGKISTGCTGTLVGSDLVLTAAHCIVDPNTHTIYAKTIYFYANMIDGKSDHKASVSRAWRGTNDPGKSRVRDWALLRLDKKLGDTQGWFGAKIMTIDEMKTTLATLVGYSADFRNGQTASAHINCSIVKEDSKGFFLHNCDTTRGSSGGPIFSYWNGQPYIYALNVAEYRNGGDESLILPNYTDTNANVAIWSRELFDKIVELKSS